MGNFLTSERVRVYTNANLQMVPGSIGAQIYPDRNATVHVFTGPSNGCPIYFNLVPRFAIEPPFEELRPFNSGTRFTFVNYVTDAEPVIVITKFVAGANIRFIQSDGTQTELGALTIEKNQALTITLSKQNDVSAWILQSNPMYDLTA